MSEPQGNRQKTLEQLAGAVSIHGWKDFEVSLDAHEFRIERHGGTAACTVVLLPQEGTFQAHFAFPNLSASAISFNIGESVVNQAVPAVSLTATMTFRDVDEAARWLLQYLEAPSRARAAESR